MDDIASSGRLNIWSERVKDFGLGVDLEIDLPSATTGIVPIVHFWTDGLESKMGDW